MKTYKEMAKSVFYRRKEYVEARSRRREAVKVWLVCVLFAFILSSVGAVMLRCRHQPGNIILVTSPSGNSTVEDESILPVTSGTEQSIPTETTEHSEAKKNHMAKISLVNVITKEEETLREGVSLPLNIDIDVEDIRWLTKEQRDAIKKEKQEKIDMYSIAEETECKLSRIDWNRDTLVAVYSIGGIVVSVEDFHDIDCITLKGGYWGNLATLLRKDLGVGHTWMYLGIDIPSEVLCKNYKSGESSTLILWQPSYHAFYEIYKNPKMDLSEIKDRVQIIIWYVNGDVDVYNIDIFFDQDGVGYAMIAEDEVAQ